MKMKVRAIRDAGVRDKERIVFDVLEDTNINEYAVLLSEHVSSDGAKAGPMQAYWFVNTVVSAGDLVVLYTKDGIRRSKDRANGSMSHFSYWSLPTPVFTEPEIGFIIIEMGDWNAITAQDEDDTDL